MAGNGGQMADTNEAVLKNTEPKWWHVATKDNACLEMSEKLNSRPRRTGKKKTGAAGFGEEAETNAEAHERVTAQVCAEANRVLGEKCVMIANALMGKTLLGDVRCAKLLFALAEPKGGGASSLNKRLRELALALEDDPELPGDLTEAATGMFGGGPEVAVAVVSPAELVAIAEAR
jgi:hypothetical protein